MTCETLTLGHNPFELPLSKFGVFLPSNRPQFLCERMISGGATVAEMEAPESPNSGDTDGENGGANEMKTAPGLTRQKSHFFSTSGAFSPNAQYDPDGEIDPLDRSEQGALDRSGTSLDLDRSGSSRFRRRRKSKNANGSKSSSALLGAFESVFEEATKNDQTTVIEQMVDALSPRVAKAKEAQAAQKNRELRAMFDAIDDDGSGELDKDEFAEAYVKVRADLTREQIDQLFDDADTDGNGTLDFDEFKVIASLSGAALLSKLSTANTGDVVGFANVEWSREKFFGEKLLSERPADLEGGDRAVAETQTLAMRLYESRVASLERAIAFFVLFHEMGARVSAFWPGVSRGLLGYRIDRTHSIMRIATTASPVSGADVRDRMREMARHKQFSTALFGIGKVSGAARGALKRLRANGHGVNFFKRAMMRSPSMKKVHRSFEDFQKLVDPKVGMSISDSDSSSNESNGVARARRESAPRRVDPPVAANGMNIEMIVEDRESYGPSFEGLPSCSCNAASEMLF